MSDDRREKRGKNERKEKLDQSARMKGYVYTKVALLSF